MNAVVNFNGVELELLKYKNTWALSNRQVADGFGVDEVTIRSQKSRNEYKDGVHFYVLQNATGNAMQTFWTKKGVITLGFKLRETPQTIAFRDWASDFIIKSDASISKVNPKIEIKLTETITALNQKSLELDSFKSKYYESLERENLLLRSQSEATKSIKIGTRISKQERLNIIELHKNGLSQAEICREVNRSESAVRKILRSVK